MPQTIYDGSGANYYVDSVSPGGLNILGYQDVTPLYGPGQVEGCGVLCCGDCEYFE